MNISIWEKKILAATISFGFANAAALAIEPYQATPVQRYEAHTIEPMQGRQVQPYRAPQVQPYQAPQAHIYRAPQTQRYQARPGQAYRAPQTGIYHSGQVAQYEGAGQVRRFTQQDLEEMRRNDVAAGRTSASMTRRQGGGNASDAQSRVNHYSNMNTMNNRMNEAGTLGYNPFRNQ